MLVPLVKQDSGRASMGVKGAPVGRDGCRADGVLSGFLLVFHLKQLVCETA